MVRKYIPVPIHEKEKFNQENYIDKYITINFCKYIFKKGMYEGKKCSISCYKESGYCKKHFVILERKKYSEIKRNNIQRCNKCNRRSIENELYCTNHKSLCKNKKTEISIHNNFNKNNLQIIKYVPNIFSNIINIHLVENKKEKKKKNKQRYKNNKRLKKLKKLDHIKNKENSEINFDYKKILKYKKGILFKENNIWYTYNIYEKKTIADHIDGNQCVHCGFIRYTKSGPCIYADCINRSFDDSVFHTYYNINNKELLSKYNKRIKSKFC